MFCPLSLVTCVPFLDLSPLSLQVLLSLLSPPVFQKRQILDLHCNPLSHHNYLHCHPPLVFPLHDHLPALFHYFLSPSLPPHFLSSLHPLSSATAHLIS